MAEDLVLTSVPDGDTITLSGTNNSGDMLIGSITHTEVDAIVGTDVNDGTLGSIQRGPTGPPGPPGAPGPPGPPGDSSAALAAEFNFASPATRWEAVHNLGFPPNVGLYSPLGVEISGIVTENTASRTVAEFYFPAAGRMTLS